jgi:predicted flap endonuclease-1-like 5' DNA nuclease
MHNSVRHVRRGNLWAKAGFDIVSLSRERGVLRLFALARGVRTTYPGAMKTFVIASFALALNFHVTSLMAAEKAAAPKGTLQSIQGVGEANEKKLVAAGVTNVDQLLETGATPKGRKELAEKSGISDAQILKFVNYADLFRIKGIAGQNAELLEAAGVDSVAELARRNPANLTAKLKEVNETKKLSGNNPGEKQVTAWINAAKALPKKVQY